MRISNTLKEIKNNQRKVKFFTNNLKKINWRIQYEYIRKYNKRDYYF